MLTCKCSDSKLRCGCFKVMAHQAFAVVFQVCNEAVVCTAQGSMERYIGSQCIMAGICTANMQFNLCHAHTSCKLALCRHSIDSWQNSEVAIWVGG